MAGRIAVVNSYRIKESQQDRRYSAVESEDPSDWDDSYISFIKAAHHLNALREKAYAEESSDDPE